jgi:formamidopyrimidine-DNA glycosylase
MPELPEVESAVRRLRQVTVGKTIRRVELRHASLARWLTPAQLRSLRGAIVASVDRRGKHQLIMLGDGRALHAHFRMAGDWIVDRVTEALPKYARAVIDFTDGSRVVLNDSRALSTLVVHPAGADLSLGLGPEPSDPSLTATSLHAALAKRRGPIKPVLLDQRVIAGLGNIYAAESLWHARIAPTAQASSLTLKQVTDLLRAIRAVIKKASGARYKELSWATRFAVYDREGKRCRRCGSTIARIAQAGRSTYFCPECQVGGASRAPRRARP